jgi:hypothetical protein
MKGLQKVHNTRIAGRIPLWQALLFMVIMAFSAATTYAQVGGGFDLSWSTLDGGGGTSAGDLYTIDGTVGQPDAGLHSGGTYSVEGGYWGGASVPVGPPVVAGHVSWQGRPAQPHALQSLPITLTLCLPGTPSVTYPNRTTDASGTFTVTANGLPGGQYNWWVKGPKYLANGGTVALTGGQTTAVEMGLLRAGDANNDNLVTAVDFSILRNTFGLGIGNAGYDDRADFNGDQVVAAQDFSLLRNNFGFTGALQLCP